MLKIQLNFIINNKNILLGKWTFTKLFTKLFNAFLFIKNDLYIYIYIKDLLKKIFSLCLIKGY